MRTWFSYSKSQKIKSFIVLWIKTKQNKTKNSSSLVYALKTCFKSNIENIFFKIFLALMENIKKKKKKKKKIVVFLTKSANEKAYLCIGSQSRQKF